ncbi:MAG: element excision factor XisI family protein [Scytonema sp. PMC 1069.18]|nr:element excision factor XisI family protein [Scytonema sp. PMC 1069.18]MEC4879836.1 element excision factor XisI family protein [Scytonema sp. PMC 1070.18]
MLPTRGLLKHPLTLHLIYVIIENRKVIIEYDGMECGITQDLINKGILEHDIVLAFLPDSQPVSIA